MAQKLFGLGIGGSGIVAVLIVAGVILKLTGASPQYGDLAIGAGVAIAIIFGLLGVLGIIKRLAR